MPDDLTSLPDFPALQQLARALWRDGSARGAALLVGAGFSKNAILPGGDTPEPPLWSDLLKDLRRQLYPHDAQSTPANPLRIAEEYRTYYGQAALDGFIGTRFPDRAWLPGPLHTELLEFPWSDVLTTNWDTLLERTAEESIDYVYEVVRLETDLPHARSPRIVKLHGSIGDAGPLIFAEEDYRTYPAKHAAFVNLARQIFIENELCLVGFSGDDPNFLQWAGWVRDHLGGNARRIYLVGNLHLAGPTRKFFESHNIAPIDFAPAVKQLPRPERHAAATRLFFDALKMSKPVPLHEWRRAPSSEYPLHAGSDAYERARTDDAFAAQALDKTAALFKSDRENYPGWLVCPRIWRHPLQHQGDEAWLLREFVLSRFEPTRRAEIIHELLWRRTIGFLPLQHLLVRSITEILQSPSPTIEQAERFAFAVALMRHARVSNDDDSLDKWGKLIETEAPPTSLPMVEAQYQRCLRARDRLDLEGLAAGLAKLDDVQDPIWKIRCAALHIEIGQHVKATKLIKEATADLDKRHRLDRASLWIKSRLGWANWLSRAASLGSRTDTPRPREFKELQIDPALEIEQIEDAADEIQSRRQEDDAEIIPLFEAGILIRVVAGDPALGLAYELDQLTEVAGLPILINHLGICRSATIGAVKITYRHSVEWYTSLLRALYSHLDKSFDRYFGRIAIAQLPGEVSDKLLSIVDRAILFWVERIKLSQGPEFKDDLGAAIDKLHLLLFAQSRLTVRMSENDAMRAFQGALQLAKNPLISYYRLFEAVGEVVHFAAQAIREARRGALALSVLEFPLSSEKRSDTRVWPNVVTSIWVSTPDRPQCEPRWDNRVSQLIDAAKRGGSAREEAISRLAYLAINKSLSLEQASAFGQAIWSELDGNESALPSRTGLLPSALAQLPSSEGVDALARVRARLFCVDLQTVMALPERVDSRIIQEKLNHLISIQQAEAIGLAPAPDTAAQLFDQIVEWEPKVPDGRDPFGTSALRSFNNEVRLRTGYILAQVLVPAMDAGNRTEQRASAVLQFMVRTKSWPSLAGIPYFVATSRSLTEDIVTAVRRGIVGSEHQQVRGAAGALVCWGKLVREGVLSELPRELVEQLIGTIETRQGEGLLALLGAASSLLKQEFLESEDMTRLTRAVTDLHTETQYDEVILNSRKAVTVSLIRAECVKLAMALIGRVNDDGTLQEWIDAAPCDPLPEVRFSTPER